jgi:hypothetical protein
VSTNSTLDYLESLWPRQALVPALEAGKCLSYAPQTTRNKLAKGQFPIRTVLVGGKRLVKKTDLAQYIDDLGTERKRRGRPTKAEILSRERGNQ